jgi:polyadenylate-binding protein
MWSKERETDLQLEVTYIGENTDAFALSNAFKCFGTVISARIITTWESGEPRSLGFGFVHFSTADAVQAATQSKVPVVIDGQRVAIWAMLLLPLGRSVSTNENRGVVVRNIDWETGGRTLAEAFMRFGPVAFAKIRRSGGLGYVRFASLESATAAIANIDPLIVDGRVLFISYPRVSLVGQTLGFGAVQYRESPSRRRR